MSTRTHLGFRNRGIAGVDPHRVEFETSIRTISYEDVPALEDAPDDVSTDDGLDDARELADELEAANIWPN